MNLVALLMKGHSKAHKNKIVRYVGKDPKRFSALVKVFLTGDYRVTQRAAWPLSDCVKKHAELINPHLKAILLNARKKGTHDAVRRNTVRLLQFITVPTRLQGLTVDVCMKLLSNLREPVAIRCFSMTVLANITAEQPALKNELFTVIQDQMPYGTAGFLARARKVLRQLEALS